MSKKIAVIDTETATMKGPVIDLAIVEIDEELNVIGDYEALIDPVRPIAPAAQEVHGITNKMVQDEPTMAELLERDGNQFAGYDELIVIGHNVQFDCRMLAPLLPERYTPVCTLRMSKNQWPDIDTEECNYKLGTLAIMFGLGRGPAHRAMGDVITCLNLLRHIADTAKVGSFAELIALGRRPLSLETYIGFGKHGPNGSDKLTDSKGTKLKDLPLSYVRWYLNQNDIDPDLREALALRLK